MGLNLYLQSLTVPEGTEFPGTVQELLDLIAQYEGVEGGNPFSGINYGSATPDASNRDRPWFKTTTSGDPVGWYSWNGSVWALIPNNYPHGNTASRPTAPTTGDQYFDTQINCQLVYERGQWRTLSGTPGDVKFVAATTLAIALLNNPGWIQDPSSLGRLIGAAGDPGGGLPVRSVFESVGAAEVTLEQTNLPVNATTHTHTYNTYPQPARWKADGNASDPAGNLSGYVAQAEEDTGATNVPGGDATPFSIINPCIFYWALIKQ